MGDRCACFHRFGFVSFLLAIVILTGCQNRQPPPPEPQDIVARSAARMESLASFRFLIERQGEPAFLDQEQTLSFRRTEGYFVAPDRAWAVVRVIAPGLVAEVQVIGIGEDYWETQLLTNAWQRLPRGQGFNPALLFDPRTGFTPILQQDLSGLQLSGMETLDAFPGKTFYALSGKLDGKRVYDLSYGLMGPAEMDVRLWIEPEIFNLARVILFEPSLAGEGRTWQMDFWDYNQDLSVDPPAASPPLP